jgi:hypothetical protein
MKKTRMAGLALLICLLIMSSYSYGQCELPIPEGGKNLCAEPLTIANTPSSITIANPKSIPTSFASSYTVTAKYYDESIYECLLINCSNATLSATSSSIIIDPGAGVTLPEFTSSFIIWLTIVPNGPGDSYFLIWVNGGCALPLGNDIALAVKKLKLSGVSKMFVQRK